MHFTPICVSTNEKNSHAHLESYFLKITCVQKKSKLIDLLHLHQRNKKLKDLIYHSLHTKFYLNNNDNKKHATFEELSFACMKFYFTAFVFLCALSLNTLTNISASLYVVSKFFELYLVHEYLSYLKFLHRNQCSS